MIKAAIKVLAVTSLAVVAAICLRVAIKKVSPGMYASVWGQAATPSVQAASQVPEAVVQPQNSAVPVPEGVPAHVYVRGYVSKGRRATAILTDGRVIVEDGLKLIDGRYVETRAGDRFYLMPVEMGDVRAGASLMDAKQPALLGVATVAAAPSLQQPQDEGAWIRGVDGVARLKPDASLGLTQSSK